MRRPAPKDFNSLIFLWTRRGLLIFCSGWHLFLFVTVIAAPVNAASVSPSPTTTNGAQ